jgi:hypothetical protein
MANGIYRSDEGLIQVSVAGVPLDNIAWDTMEGGELSASSNYYHPGNQGPGLELGGLRVPSALTVMRGWSDTLYGLYVALYNAAGFTTGSVSYVPRSKGGATLKPTTYQGVLLTVTRPNYSASTDDATYLSLVFGLSESASQN